MTTTTADIALPVQFIIPDALDGARLDAALQQVFPQLGVRARRRLWDWCSITINGKRRAAGFLVEAGSILRVAALDQPEATNFTQAEGDTSVDGSTADASCCAAKEALPRLESSISLVHATEHMVALYKPAGIHSAIIKGGNEPSVEGYLQQSWESVRDTWQKSSHVALPFVDTLPLLVTRLDKPTSGLVLGVSGRGQEAEFRRLEAEGKVTKQYFAVVYGTLRDSLHIKRCLGVANKKITTVLDYDGEDPTRYTQVEPLGWGQIRQRNECWNVTLVRATIQRGARHQIRAHLAYAGFFIVGDFVYAGDVSFAAPMLNAGENAMVQWEGFTGSKSFMVGGRDVLFLHHAHVRMPDFSACCMPYWQGVPAELLVLCE